MGDAVAPAVVRGRLPVPWVRGPADRPAGVRPRSAFVRANAVESLNFNLSWLLYGVIAVILAFVLIGFVILIVLGIAYLALVIIASVKANNGEVYRYPATIRFVR